MEVVRNKREVIRIYKKKKIPNSIASDKTAF